MEIFFGTQQGIPVYNHIKHAQKSIHIISPYISPSYMSLLAKKTSNNVKVNIITSKKFYKYRYFYKKRQKLLQKVYFFLLKNKPQKSNSFLKKIINWTFAEHPSQDIEYYKFIKKCTQKDLSQYAPSIQHNKYFFPLIATTIASYTLACFYALFLMQTMLHTSAEKLTMYILTAFALIQTALIPLIYNKKRLKHRYTFIPNLSFTIFSPTPGDNDQKNELHAKIYIIDEEVAFLGSLNMTKSGFHYNHETCIKITVKEQIQKLLHYYKDLEKQQPPFPSTILTKDAPHIHEILARKNIK